MLRSLKQPILLATADTLKKLCFSDSGQLDSQAGGLHDLPGSAATQSQAPNRTVPKRKAACSQENSPPAENLWIDGTQPSQAGGAPATKKVRPGRGMGVQHVFTEACANWRTQL